MRRCSSNAVTFAFESPARQAFLAEPRAASPTFRARSRYSSTAMALAFATGPALGGLLIAGAGVEAAYAAFGVLVLGNLIGLAFVRPLREIGDRTPPSLRAVREGLAFVRAKPDRARLHGARHVRGDPGRRDGAAAGLREEILAVGRARLRPALLVARDRRARDGGALADAPADRPRGAGAARGGRGLRARDARLRPLALVPALGGALHARGRRRPGERGAARHRRAAHHARRAARPRLRGEHDLHHRLESARRGRVGLPRRRDERHVRGRVRRHRVPARRRVHGVAAARAAELS